MSEQDSRRIVRERMSEPHVAGRRVPVLTIRDRVEGAGQAPGTVADELKLDVADVYRALAYYHEHPEEMAAVRERRAESHERVADEAERRRPEGVTPPGDDR